MKYPVKSQLVPAMVLLVACTLLAACAPADPAVRIIFESPIGGASTARVLVEGSDGNLVTGATVVVRNSAGAAVLLGFSYDDGAYTGVIPASTDGEYSITVDSSLMAEAYTRTVTHRVLEDGPDITLLQDESAASALSGATMDRSQALNIGWNAVSNATVYQVRILRTGSEVLVSSVAGTSFTLPAGTLTAAGSYLVQVNAQYIAGDPLLLDADYYCFSEAAGPSVLFLLR